MVPAFIVEETTIRDSGEGPVLDCAGYGNRPMMLTLGITHAVERQRLDLELYGSHDGVNWIPTPLAAFTPKYYCGTYEVPVAVVPRFVKAVWKVNRWGVGDRRPYFRFYVFGEPAVARAMAGAA